MSDDRVGFRASHLLILHAPEDRSLAAISSNAPYAPKVGHEKP